MASSSSAAPAPGVAAALPAADFLSIGGAIKEKLRALQNSRAAAKAARATAVAAFAADSMRFDADSDGEAEQQAGAAAAASSASAAASPAAASASQAAEAAKSTPARSSPPIGFGADEEFISLAFDDDDAAAPATAPRNGKRKAGEDGEATPATPRRPQSEGAYRAPWATGEYRQANFTLRLHEEILDFCTYVSPSEAEQAMRAELIGRIESIVREAFPQSPDVHLRPFGSYATKLYLPISDIDLVLFGADPGHATHPTMDKGKNSALAILERTMRAKQNATYLEHISGARIPILKFTDKATGVKVDICYEIEGGLKAAEYIVRQQQQLPALRPLTLLLKYFLHCRILNDTYKGGIGSFMLQLMLINHLQTLHHSGRLNHPATNLGMLLMSFLECYGVSLNYKNAGLNMNSGGNIEAVAGSSNSKNARPTASSSAGSSSRTSFFNKAAKGWFNANRPYLLSIENPLDPNHDVGSNSYLILRVRRALQFAFQTLAAHVHYEALARERGERPSKKQRHDLTVADPAHPFAGAASTPQTLLALILSVNDEIRPGQEEVEYEEMEQELARDQAEAKQRARHVHRIASDDDDGEVQIIAQPSFGDVDMNVSSSDSDAAASAMEGGEADVDGALARFESGFAGDGAEDGAESSSDDEDASGEDSDDSDAESDGGVDIAVDDATYDDGELFTTPAGSKRRKQFSSSAHHPPPPPPPPGDFIPLSGGGGGNGSRQHAPGSSRKKNAQYAFASNGPQSAKKQSKKSKKKQKPLLQGKKAGGTKPNNAIYESNRSKEKKQSKKKADKQSKKKQQQR